MNREQRRAAASTHPFGWTPWERATAIPPTKEQIAETHRNVAHLGYTLDDVRAQFAHAAADTIFKNNVYQVAIRMVAVRGHLSLLAPEQDRTGRPVQRVVSIGTMRHLSIKRIDRKPVGVERFAHFQRIKNDLVGPEYEAAELYPATSRLTDLANQYHLWALPSKRLRFPFGFIGHPPKPAREESSDANG